MGRLVTTIAIIVLTSVALARGSSILQFAYATSRSRPLSPGAYRPWIGAAGLTTEALDVDLSANLAATDADATRRRIALLTEFLAFRPLSPVQWLSLAGMRLVAARSKDEALAAAAMSSISGPNEGGVMWQRGIFGLLQWEALPADAQQRSIADLSGVILGDALRDAEVNEAKTVAGTKSPEVRSQIESMLIGEGVSPTALTRMGL